MGVVEAKSPWKERGSGLPSCYFWFSALTNDNPQSSDPLLQLLLLSVRTFYTITSPVLSPAKSNGRPSILLYSLFLGGQNGKAKILYVVAFRLRLSASSAIPALAQLTKLNVGYGAITGDQLPAWTARSEP